MSKLWFKAKDYGWGWYPSAWQGWLVVLGYIVILAVIFILTKNYIVNDSDVFIFLIPVAIATALLLFICYKKGERPEWRWGKKKEK
jgi:hypothetical protein